MAEQFDDADEARVRELLVNGGGLGMDLFFVNEILSFLAGMSVFATLYLLWPLSWVWGTAVIVVIFVLTGILIPGKHNQKINIDLASKRVFCQLRGILLPWTWRLSTHISNMARFEVRTFSAASDSHVLYLDPHPKALFSVWGKIQVLPEQFGDSGKAFLNRVAEFMNRQLRL